MAKKTSPGDKPIQKTPSKSKGAKTKATSASSLRQQLAQREAELSIIHSIQQGLAARLDFQSIVDLVGDKLREILDTGDFSINWYDEKNNLSHYLYTYEHGKRLNISPQPPTPGGQFETMFRTHLPIVANNPTDFE